MHHRWCMLAQSFLTLCGLMAYIACQAPLSMGLSRQEYWNRLPFPPPGDLPDPRIKQVYPALQVDSFPAEPSGNTISCFWGPWDGNSGLHCVFSLCSMLTNMLFSKLKMISHQKLWRIIAFLGFYSEKDICLVSVLVVTLPNLETFCRHYFCLRRSINVAISSPSLLIQK